MSGLDKISGKGIINLDMHAVGPVKGVTSAEIMRALNGTTALNVSNLLLPGCGLPSEAKFHTPCLFLIKSTEGRCRMRGDLDLLVQRRQKLHGDVQPLGLHEGLGRVKTRIVSNRNVLNLETRWKDTQAHIAQADLPTQLLLKLAEGEALYWFPECC